MATATKPKEKEALDFLQHAVSDLTEARSKVSEDARKRIDSALERVRDAVTDLRSRARGEATDWEKTLEKAGDDALLEIGRLVVRAQRTPTALTALSTEIRKRKVELTP